MNKKHISVSTLRRLPIYLNYLNSIKDEKRNISSCAIAAFFGLNPVQVRKDLGVVSGLGKPKTGYVTEMLITQLEACLGCHSETKAVLIGAGNLGKALMHYNGFADYGLKIICAFDTNEELIGTCINNKPIYSLEDVQSFCKNNNIRLGIITTPLEGAQESCNLLVDSGITAIWNFAPIILKVSDNVLIENENLASSLAILSNHMHKDDKEEDNEFTAS